MSYLARAIASKLDQAVASVCPEGDWYYSFGQDYRLTPEAIEQLAKETYRLMCRERKRKNERLTNIDRLTLSKYWLRAAYLRRPSQPLLRHLCQDVLSANDFLAMHDIAMAAYELAGGLPSYQIIEETDLRYGIEMLLSHEQVNAITPEAIRICNLVKLVRNTPKLVGVKCWIPAKSNLRDAIRELLALGNPLVNRSLGVLVEVLSEVSPQTASDIEEIVNS